MNRRQFIEAGAACAGTVALAVDEKTADGGFAPVSWADRTRRDLPLLPPGAHSVRRFAAKCVGCGLCAAACPSKCLRPSTDPRRMGRVELDFRYGWCKPGCTRCGEVCPAGAIEKVEYVSKRLYHVGYASWNRSACVRTTDGVECHACEKHCPVRAVRIVAGFPVVDRVACIGCGACEHYCPARPVAAIRVIGVERHREIAPMDETDLLDEMKRQVAEGRSAVIARDGIISVTLDGRGLEPIKKAISENPDIFSGAIVADKVVGIGAAEIYIRGKARTVWGKVMSDGARLMLENASVAPLFDTLVPQLDCERGRKKVE